MSLSIGNRDLFTFSLTDCPCNIGYCFVGNPLDIHMFHMFYFAKPVVAISEWWTFCRRFSSHSQSAAAVKRVLWWEREPWTSYRAGGYRFDSDLFFLWGALLCCAVPGTTAKQRQPRLTRSINPDEVVAHGAALQAAALSVQGKLGICTWFVLRMPMFAPMSLPSPLKVDATKWLISYISECCMYASC